MAHGGAGGVGFLSASTGFLLGFMWQEVAGRAGAKSDVFARRIVVAGTYMEALRAEARPDLDALACE